MSINKMLATAPPRYSLYKRECPVLPRIRGDVFDRYGDVLEDGSWRLHWCHLLSFCVKAIRDRGCKE